MVNFSRIVLAASVFASASAFASPQTIARGVTVYYGKEDPNSRSGHWQLRRPLGRATICADNDSGSVMYDMETGARDMQAKHCKDFPDGQVFEQIAKLPQPESVIDGWTMMLRYQSACEHIISAFWVLYPLVGKSDPVTLDFVKQTEPYTAQIRCEDGVIIPKQIYYSLFFAGPYRMTPHSVIVDVYDTLGGMRYFVSFDSLPMSEAVALPNHVFMYLEDVADGKPYLSPSKPIENAMQPERVIQLVE